MRDKSSPSSLPGELRRLSDDEEIQLDSRIFFRRLPHKKSRNKFLMRNKVAITQFEP
jgi:hypothetical protein